MVKYHLSYWAWDGSPNCCFERVTIFLMTEYDSASERKTRRMLTICTSIGEYLMAVLVYLSTQRIRLRARRPVLVRRWKRRVW